MLSAKFRSMFFFLLKDPPQPSHTHTFPSCDSFPLLYHLLQAAALMPVTKVCNSLFTATSKRSLLQIIPAGLALSVPQLTPLQPSPLSPPPHTVDESHFANVYQQKRKNYSLLYFKRQFYLLMCAFRYKSQKKTLCIIYNISFHDIISSGSIIVVTQQKCDRTTASWLKNKNSLSTVYNKIYSLSRNFFSNYWCSLIIINIITILIVCFLLCFSVYLMSPYPIGERGLVSLSKR